MTTDYTVREANRLHFTPPPIVRYMRPYPMHSDEMVMMIKTLSPNNYHNTFFQLGSSEQLKNPTSNLPPPGAARLGLALPLLFPDVAGQTLDGAQTDQTRYDPGHDLAVPDPSVPVLVSEVTDYGVKREDGELG